MSVLDAIRQFISQCPHLDGLTGGMHVDWIDQNDPTDYGIFNGGDVILNTYMEGGYRKQQTFYIQSTRMSANDVMRLDNSAHIEKIQNWVNDRQFNEFEMPENTEFERITLGNGTPFDMMEDGDTYVYRITGNLIYERTV